jgi:hypothetical protein
MQQPLRIEKARTMLDSAGVDQKTVDQLGDYLKQHWPAIREQLLNGTSEPKPMQIDPEARLSRAQAAEALTRRGYQTAYATLSTLATRGSGPPFAKFGPRAIYRWQDLLDWAQSRTSKPARSTSELAATNLT